MTAIERWQIEVETPVGAQFGTLELTHCGTAIDGRLYNESGELILQEGSVDGDTLRWTVTLSRPIAMTITCQALRQGDTLNGSAMVAAFGDFTFTGRRETV